MIRICTIASLLLMLLPATGAVGSEDTQPRDLVLGHPGFIVITGGLDSTLGYRWQLGPAVGQRSLTWPNGSLVVPEAMELESLRGIDLLIPVGAELGGMGQSGRLLMQEGIYPVTELIHFSDGQIQLMADDGELEIKGQRVRYTAPEAHGTDPRAGYVFLAGMVLLVFVLLRRLAVQRKKRHAG